MFWYIYLYLKEGDGSYPKEGPHRLLPDCSIIYNASNCSFDFSNSAGFNRNHFVIFYNIHATPWISDD